MERLYDIRLAKSLDNDGVLHIAYYATTFHEGAEWCVNDKGEPESPLGNVFADEDEVVAIGVSYTYWGFVRRNEEMLGFRTKRWGT